VLIVAFDTATDVATSALVRDGEVLGELASLAVRVLEDVDALLNASGLDRSELDALVIGTGPGSFTGLRIGLASARALAFALDLPLAGVSTLAALAAARPGVLPIIDARRREIFTLSGGEPVCLAPAELEIDAGTVCVGAGALRYRSLLEAAGAEVPPRESELHVPRARFHASLARGFGPAERVEPIYLRVPDAERTLG
jgi:tRNA threonylcarbamoyladenosine biosynthesis protein TsaB